MAWSRSRPPTASARTCGWSAASVISSLCGSQGSLLLTSSAVHTWLACLVVCDHGPHADPEADLEPHQGLDFISIEATRPLGQSAISVCYIAGFPFISIWRLSVVPECEGAAEPGESLGYRNLCDGGLGWPQRSLGF